MPARPPRRAQRPSADKPGPAAPRTRAPHGRSRPTRDHRTTGNSDRWASGVPASGLSLGRGRHPRAPPARRNRQSAGMWARRRPDPAPQTPRARTRPAPTPAGRGRGRARRSAWRPPAGPARDPGPRPRWAGHLGAHAAALGARGPGRRTRRGGGGRRGPRALSARAPPGPRPAAPGGRSARGHRARTRGRAVGGGPGGARPGSLPCRGAGARGSPCERRAA